MTVEEIVGLANRYIEEGKSVDLYDCSVGIVLQVFEGDRWLGGAWKKVAVAPCAERVQTPARKYGCARRFIYANGKITLTPCPDTPCLQQVLPGEPKIDYRSRCDLKA